MLPTFRSATAAFALAGAAALPFAARSAPSGGPTEQVSARNTPAMVAGLWCGAGLLHKYALEIAQHYHLIEARLSKGNRVHRVTGRMEGTLLRADPQRDHTIDLLAQGDELRIVRGTGVLALARGLSFTRAVGGSCTH